MSYSAADVLGAAVYDSSTDNSIPIALDDGTSCRSSATTLLTSHSLLLLLLNADSDYSVLIS